LENSGKGAIFGGGKYIDETGNSDLHVYNLARKVILGGITRLFPRFANAQGWNIAFYREEAIRLGGFIDEGDKCPYEDLTLVRKFAKNNRFERLENPYTSVVTSGRRILKDGVYTSGLKKFLGDLLPIVGQNEVVKRIFAEIYCKDVR
jgi:hypothetical protein